MKRIKIYVGTLGMDQHEVGAIAVSRLLRDAGMEVVYAGRFNLPPGIIRSAMEEDVDIIGLSCHSWEYLYFMPELFKLMKEQDYSVPVIAGGSVITPTDGRKLIDMGVSAVFGPGAPESEIIETVKSIAEKSGNSK